ncbi:hypothetical protein [Candidatus Nitrospira bockiana]
MKKTLGDRLYVLLLTLTIAVGLSGIGYTAYQQYITGDVAHDSPDGSTNPVKIGGKASASVPADVTDGDRVNASFDLKGRQRMIIDTAVAPTNYTPADGCTRNIREIEISSATTTTLESVGAGNYGKILGGWLRVDRTGVATTITIQDAAGKKLLGSPWDFAAGDSWSEKDSPNILGHGASGQNIQIITGAAGPVRGVIYTTNCAVAP